MPLAALWPAGPGSESSREFDATVISVEPIMGDAVLLTLHSPASIVRGVRAGQFFNIACRFESSRDPLLRRPYSVYRTDIAAATLTFLVRPYGRGSTWLAARTPGETIDMMGALGNSFTFAGRTTRVLMVGGGVGVAPLVMLSDVASAKGLDIVFVMGAATEAGLLPGSELPGTVEYVVATDDGSRGRRGLATDVVAEFVPWADQIFACGPEPMYESLRAVVNASRLDGHPKVQISVERDMACGVGVCLGCVVETTHGMATACVQGPVFDLDEVIG
jgi:dihydroorotate dehydrogenase electron transfer subunit